MPRDDAITFSDLTGKLPTLRVTCDKCDRGGIYRLSRLIRVYGGSAKVIDWLDVITSDCPKKSARNADQCGAQCPDLPKVL